MVLFIKDQSNSNTTIVINWQKGILKYWHIELGTGSYNFE